MKPPRAHPRLVPLAPRLALFLFPSFCFGCAEVQPFEDAVVDRWVPPDAEAAFETDGAPDATPDHAADEDGATDEGAAGDVPAEDGTAEDAIDAVADDSAPGDDAADDAGPDDAVADDGATDDAGPATCAGARVGGHCWYLGANETWSCTRVCAGHGGYGEGTRTYAGSGGTNANCDDVLDALGVAYRGVSTLTGSGAGVGCFFMATADVRYRVGDTPTNPDATYILSRRACACNE